MTETLIKTIAQISAMVRVCAFVPAQTRRLSGDSMKIGVLSDIFGFYGDQVGYGSVLAVRMPICLFSKLLVAT